MDQVAQIKQTLDIVSVVGSYVELKKSGKNYKGVCPFHSENTPSFMVSSELQIYKCFGCGEAGDIINFVQKIEGLDFAETLQLLADKAGIKLEQYKPDPEAALKADIYKVNEQATRFYHHILTKHALGKPGLEYLIKKRHLNMQVIQDFQLGYAPEGWDNLLKFFESKKIDRGILHKSGLITTTENGKVMDKFRGRVVFPLTGVDGNVVGFTGRTLFDRQPKYLNTSETPVFHKSFFIYGLDRAKMSIKKQGALLVEGQMDVISAHSKGITNTIASSGTSLTQGQLKILARYTNSLTFCFDSDAAGITASFRGIELAENMGFDIKIAAIPKDAKDLDEMLQRDVSEAQNIITSAVPAYDFLLFTIINKYNKDSPDGKKKIMDELVPWFARIKNGVLIDHYTKQIAQELDLDVTTVAAALKNPLASEFKISAPVKPLDSGKMSQQSLESYIISLLLKGGLDFMASELYKVDPEHYLDQNLKKVLVSLQEYISGVIANESDFNPNEFKTSLSTDLHGIFDEVYLSDLEDALEDTKHLEKEFDSILLRLQTMYAKRRMLDISKQIKLAEKSNDLKKVQSLTSEFEQLKNILVTK